MEETPLYQMPTTDTSPFSLMLLAQFVAIFGMFVLQGAIEYRGE